MPTVLFRHSGTVIHGEKVGRQIGFPTLNIDSLPGGNIAKGVYAGTCSVDDKSYDCIVYFGPRLIFGEQKDCFEAYLYDFDQEIYGKFVSFELFAFTRPPLPFTSLPDLQAQLEKDKVEGQKVLNRV
jgi:riboflavin kinase / FMN adenylyltransferase